MVSWARAGFPDYFYLTGFAPIFSGSGPDGFRIFGQVKRSGPMVKALLLGQVGRTEETILKRIRA
jgi:hypothetical protein